MYIVVPAGQQAYVFGQDFYQNVSEHTAAAFLPVPEYPLNQPAANSDLQITVSSAENGQYTFASTRFFIVLVHLKNLKNSENIRLTGGNFELIDSRGSRYLPYGIGSQVIYDIRPLESGFLQLTYIIPQDAKAEKVRFTFPDPADRTRNRDVVVFRI